MSQSTIALQQVHITAEFEVFDRTASKSVAADIVFDISDAQLKAVEKVLGEYRRQAVNISSEARLRFEQNEDENFVPAGRSLSRAGKRSSIQTTSGSAKSYLVARVRRTKVGSTSAASLKRSPAKIKEGLA